MCRAKTIYLPHIKVPMFPVVLAEDVFSLARLQACPTLTFIGTVSPEGALTALDIKVGRTKSKRITYDDADALITGTEPSDAAKALGDEAKEQMQVHSKPQLSRCLVFSCGLEAGCDYFADCDMTCACDRS